MDKYIINVFNLEANVNNITPIDKFKLFRDFDSFIEALKDYESKNKLTEVEQFYFDIQIDPRQTIRLKQYLNELIKDPKWSEHPEQGLSEFDPKFYQFAFEYHTGSFKYDVENLTLHETIPGHHLQINISYHSPNQNYLTAIDYAPCNGFMEGWALFAEHLGDLMFDDPWAYYGYLQSNILRTFRIIAEILLHVEGQTPEQVIQLAKKYLTTSEQCITAEIYRYRISPGQACSYKIGLEVFKRIVKQKFNVTEMKNFLRADLLDWYKQILWNTERPLDVFLRENGVTWTFDDAL